MTSGRTRDSQQAKYLLDRYPPGVNTDEEQKIEALDSLAMRAKTPNQSIEAFLSDVARVVFKFFEFKEVCIGAKDKEGKYRYVALLGLRDEVRASLQRLSYTSADMMDTRTYPSKRVNKVIEIHLMGDALLKEGEENTYNRPSLIGMDRDSTDSMVEGDYLELSILGPDDELLGWIELSSPRDGKFPSRSTAKWLEFVSIITATFLKMKEHAKGSAR